VSKHDREIAAIRKLLMEGAKILVRTHKRLEDTNKTLDRLIRSLERGGRNGHGKPIERQ
jgi:hypothetical protein